MKRNKHVDIVIPIYNAYEDLQICVESLKKNTDLSVHRLILINDNSPDERIYPYLEEQKSDHILVFHNEKNQGFSANINLGMSQSSENDVLLLNSDTVVTKNWVENMLKCAYSSETIGTVTPLSNNATLCSVPIFCEENRLPDYLTIDQAAEVVERVSFCDYPRITVAHGFCMLVKREVIEKIGGFDAETFQRGYGEENDFCNRAEQAGYIHAMCDNVYIYHSGTKSFISKEKEKLIQQHERILEDRYPVQMHNNAVYCRDNPNKYICDNVDLFFKLSNGKKNILYVLHSDFKVGRNDNIGGTQFHVRDLKDGLSKENNVFVLARNVETLCLTIYCDGKEYEFAFYVGKADAIMLDSNREIRKVLDTILEAFAIDVVHVHHIIGLSFDIFTLAKEKNIPLVLTCHDFYYICPTVRLLSKDGKACCKEDTKQCKKCLRDTAGLIETVDYLTMWRLRIRKILDTCSKVVFPSENAKAHYMEIYPEFEEKYTVIEHGMDNAPQISVDGTFPMEQREEFTFDIDKIEEHGSNYLLKGWVNAYQMNPLTEVFYLRTVNEAGKENYIPVNLSSIDYTKGIVARVECMLPEDPDFRGKICAELILCDGKTIYRSQTEEKSIHLKEKKEKYKLRVAFIGGLSVAKGSQIVKNIIRTGADDIHWFTFGTIGDADLHNIQKKNYTEIGTYQSRDLKMLIDLHKIDVIGIVSIWPETYSYTLSEAIVNNRPAIVTDIGAPGDRMKEYQCGYTVSLANAVGEFQNYVNELKDHPEMLQNITEKATKQQLKTIEQMIEEYRELYFKLEEGQSKSLTGQYNRKFIYQSYVKENADEEIQSGQITAANEVWIREAKEYQILKSTLTYQLMIKLIHMRFPFKKQIMDVIYKMRKNK